MNTNLKVNGLARLGIKPESATKEADAFTIRPLELLKSPKTRLKNWMIVFTIVIFMHQNVIISDKNDKHI